MELCIDIINGITPIADLLNVSFANNGDGGVRATFNSHGLETNDVVMITGSTNYNLRFVITKIDADNFDLNDSVFVTNRTGTVKHVGCTVWDRALNTAALLLSSSGFSAGDIAKLAKTDIVPLGINAAFTRGGETITLDSDLTKVVDDAIGNTWSFVAPSVGSTSAYRFLGATSQRIYIPTTTPVNAKLAYKSLGSVQDFSGYTKLSFWAQLSSVSNGWNTAGKIKMCLCSDANGDVIVNEFLFDAITIANTFHSIVFDNGVALGNNIQSVAIYLIGTSSANIYLIVNNIIACNNLTHQTAIGKNDGIWESVKSIDGSIVTILRYFTGTVNGIYHGTTGNAAIYALKPIVFKGANSNTYRAYVVQPSANLTLPIRSNNAKVIGGYNPASNLVDGKTFFISNNFTGVLFQGSIDLWFENIIVANMAGITGGGTFARGYLKNCDFFASNRVCFYTSDTMWSTYSMDGCKIYNMSDTYNINIGGFMKDCFVGDINRMEICNDYSEISDTVFSFCRASAIVQVNAPDIRLNRCSFIDITTANRIPVYGLYGNIYFNQCQIELLDQLTQSVLDNVGSYYHFYKCNNSDLLVMRGKEAVIYWDTIEKQPGANGSWTIAPTSSLSRRNPVYFKLAEIAIEGNVPVTIRGWFKKNAIESDIVSLLVRDIDSNIEHAVQIPNELGWRESYVNLVPDKNKVVEVFCVVTLAAGVHCGSISIST